MNKITNLPKSTYHVKDVSPTMSRSSPNHRTSITFLKLRLATL